MAFDPDKYLSKKTTDFDPNTYLARKTSDFSQNPQESQAAPEPTTSAASAALQGFGQGGTLGYLPSLQAGFGHTVEKLNEWTGGQPASPYDELKAYFQKQNETLQAEHPVATAAGNAAGAIATLPVGGAEAKGAGYLGKLARASGIGAAYGGLQNPEVESTSQDPHAELKARLQNALTGGTIGGFTQGTIGSLGSSLAKSGEKTAQKAVVKQIGANAGQIKKILQKDEIPKIEGFLSREGLMLPGKSVEDVADQSAKILQEDGPKIGELYVSAQQDAQALSGALGKDRAGRIDGNQLADKIVEKVKASSKSHPDRNLVNKTIEDAVAPLRDMGEDANIVDLHNYRKGLDENINWTQRAQERDAVQRAYIDARNSVADATKDAIGGLGKNLPNGDGRLDLLKKLNDRYSAASTINNISTQGVARETAKAFMGHGVIGAGAGVGTASLEYKRSHDPLKAVGAGILGAAAVTGARKFGSPIGFYGGKALSNFGKGLESLTPGPYQLGVGSASPWTMMKDNK